jgi:hypothetical protein
MDVPKYEDYISIAEAAKTYGTTRNFWYDSIRENKIAGYELPGHRGTFMLRADVTTYMQPKPSKLGKQTDTA